jgi:predicted transcriptional regulator of viral defense system
MNIDNINQNHTKLELLLATREAVFNINDLCIFWSQADRLKASNLATSYVKNGKMFRLLSGLYCLKKSYGEGDLKEKFVIAQKALTPSYLSYHTSLYQNGVNFQFYSAIHSCSTQKKTLIMNNQEYIYHKIPEHIFFNPLGIVKNERGFNIASKERSICDGWLINSSLGLDNINSVNLDLLLALAKLYNSPKIWKNLKLVFNIKKPKILPN